MANPVSEMIDKAIELGLDVKAACEIVRDALIETGIPSKMANEICFVEHMRRDDAARDRLTDHICGRVYARLNS